MKDLRSEIEKVASFLNKPLSEEQKTVLVKHLHFDTFAKNKSVNWESGKELGILSSSPDQNFIRKGNNNMEFGVDCVFDFVQ